MHKKLEHSESAQFYMLLNFQPAGVCRWVGYSTSHLDYALSWFV